MDLKGLTDSEVADLIKSGKISFEDWEAWEEERINPKSKTPQFDNFNNTHIENLKSGALKSLNVGWDRLIESKFLQGGTVTMLCASPGVGKTWFVHDLCLRAKSQGVKVANIQLEEDKNYHIARLIKSSLNINITDVDRVTQSELDKLDLYKNAIEHIAESIVIPKDNEKTLPKIADLVQYYAIMGFGLIVIDSISVAEKSNKPWQDDQKLMNTIKDVLVRYKTRVVLVTHPNAPVKTLPTLDLLAGGKAYQRLCQTVLWLDKNEKPANLIGEFEPCEGNRILIVMKARNAEQMQSNMILFDFKHGRFNELGWVK